MVAAAAWMLVLVTVLSAATYAWFSNSRFTNVTPVAHGKRRGLRPADWPFG